LICTLKSTVAFFMLFFTLDLAFLMLAIGYLHLVDGAPDPTLIKAGGGFGILAAFLAWYNALAGIADTSNRYVGPDPWFHLVAQHTALNIVEHSLIVLPLTASSSFPSHTSHGLKRAGRREAVTKQLRGKATELAGLCEECQLNTPCLPHATLVSFLQIWKLTA
jgi:GPR1/FUN34/yaaH family